MVPACMADMNVQPHLNIVAGVESLKIKLLPGLGGPEAQIDCVVGLETWNGVVIGNGCHLHAHGPLQLKNIGTLYG